MVRALSAWRLTLLSLVALAMAATASRAAEIGSRVDRFTLPDMYGRDRSLEEFKDKDIVVVAFLGTECPLARLYGPRLQELSEQYAEKGVAFVAVDANQQDSLTDLTHFAQNYGIKFPLLKDRDGAVADQFGAVRNPEVFLLDKKREIRYRGRVDDQYGLGGNSGYARPELKVRDLGDALDAVLAGKPVSTPVTQVTGCIIGRVAKTEPKGDITFTKHIAGLMQSKCVECHRDGQIGPFALTNYEDVAGWGQMIKEVVSDGRMPPWSANPAYGHFGNDPRLSDAEQHMLFTWVDNGCPQGDPKDMPAARKWADGWRIAKPDAIYSMPVAFHVPAEGVINYKTFTVDPGWTEDKWIQEAEVQPGALANVHHIIVSISSRGQRAVSAEEAAAEGVDAEAPRQARQARPRGERSERSTERTNDGLDLAVIRGGRLSAYIPGRNPTIYQKGTAIFAPAGSKLTFSMHYTANGKEADDISRVGVVFADPKDVKWIAHTSSASNGNFAIPPYDPDYKMSASTKFTTPASLIVLHPHMHLRGKAMRYEAFYPDGTSEILLDVPKYDFNWQFEYELAQPKFMPAGTRLHVTSSHDNSEANVANPDPGKEVRNGPQSWDEMMIGYYTTITDREVAFAAKAAADKAAAEKAKEAAGEGQ